MNTLNVNASISHRMKGKSCPHGGNISFMNLQNKGIKSFAEIKYNVEPKSIDVSGNPIVDFEGFGQRVTLGTLKADGTLINSFKGASSIASLQSVSFDKTPISQSQYFPIMCLIVFGDTLKSINNRIIVPKWKEQARKLRPQISRYLKDGYVLTGIHPLTISKPNSNENILLDVPPNELSEKERKIKENDDKLAEMRKKLAELQAKKQKEQKPKHTPKKIGPPKYTSTPGLPKSIKPKKSPNPTANAVPKKEEPLIKTTIIPSKTPKKSTSNTNENNKVEELNTESSEKIESQTIPEEIQEPEQTIEPVEQKIDIQEESPNCLLHEQLETQDSQEYNNDFLEQKEDTKDNEVEEQAPIDEIINHEDQENREEEDKEDGHVLNQDDANEQEQQQENEENQEEEEELFLFSDDIEKQIDSNEEPTPLLFQKKIPIIATDFSDDMELPQIVMDEEEDNNESPQSHKITRSISIENEIQVINETIPPKRKTYTSGIGHTDDASIENLSDIVPDRQNNENSLSGDDLLDSINE